MDETRNLQDARTSLGQLVDRAALAHETITITRNGTPRAVLVGAEDYTRHQQELEELRRYAAGQHCLQREAAYARGEVDLVTVSGGNEADLAANLARDLDLEPEATL